MIETFTALGAVLKERQYQSGRSISELRAASGLHNSAIYRCFHGTCREWILYVKLAHALKLKLSIETEEVL